MKSLVIDRSALRSNIKAIKSGSRDIEIIGDLTCDAYGLGIIETAKLLRDERVKFFAVSEVREAASLRDNGFIDEKIMMLRSTSDSGELAELMDLDVIFSIGSQATAEKLNSIAGERKTVCEAKIEIDTGLGRYGFTEGDIESVASVFRDMPNLDVIGVYSVFSGSSGNRKSARDQNEIFGRVLDSLTGMGINPGMRHIADTESLFSYDFGRFDAVRTGAALSGRTSGGTVPGLSKVGYISAPIEEVAWFSKGHRSGRTVLKKPARLAVVSVGLYHGFGLPRAESGRKFSGPAHGKKGLPSVKIGGREVEIVGSIGNLHTVLDVTKVECSAGDTVVMDADPLVVKGLPRIYTD